MIRQRSETILDVLRAEARGKSKRGLLSVSAFVALVAVFAGILGATSWIIPGTAYVIWCFSAWGILFGRASRPGKAVRVLEGLIVATGFGIAIGILVALFSLALGSPWIL